MLNRFLRRVLMAILGLRYDLRFEGLEEVKADPRRPILFLATHPSLLDPLFLVVWLYADFHARGLADARAVSAPGVRWLTQRAHTIELPDLGREGRGVRDQVIASLRACSEALARGENILLFPAGRISLDGAEHYGANSAVFRLLREAPGVRVVLVRVDGMWGSSFSRGRGAAPRLVHELKRGILKALRAGLFAMRRREVTIRFLPPEPIPSFDSAKELNLWLEQRLRPEPEAVVLVP